MNYKCSMLSAGFANPNSLNAKCFVLKDEIKDALIHNSQLIIHNSPKAVKGLGYGE